MEQEQTPDELLEHFETLYEKAYELSKRLLYRSAVNVMMEARRFAKLHRLALPYIYSCFVIANDSQALYEPEMGIDNAVEMIAYLEDPEKVKKLQADYDEDQYAYYVHQLSACAYDNLAVHTALRLGYNSPTVFGAVDDGIQVCRRTGKMECVQCFREYATQISMASGDYDMGEYYAQICATVNEREDSDDRRYAGFRALIDLYTLHGKFKAALECFDSAFARAKTFHSPEDAKTTLALKAERLFALLAREDEFPAFLAAHDMPAMPDIPSWEENAVLHLEFVKTEAVKLVRKKMFAEADRLLAGFDAKLLAQDVLDPWFEIRVARIATMRMAPGEGIAASDDINRLASELRSNAIEARHWSAIKCLDVMEKGELPLNPLGIAYPIDLGPYATPGTPVSAARLETMLPIVNKPAAGKAAEETVPNENAEENKTEETGTEENEIEETPIQRESNERFLRLEELCRNLQMRESDRCQGQDVPPNYAEERELNTLMNTVYTQALTFTPESNPTLSADDLFALIHPVMCQHSTITAEQMARLWKWLTSFDSMFKGQADYLSVCAITAHVFSVFTKQLGLDPESFGLPNAETITDWTVRACNMCPNNYWFVTRSGSIFRDHGDLRQAQYYFSRGCQLARSEPYAASALAALYARADRPKDAVAVIDLYCRAGGRHTQLLIQAMHASIYNNMPQTFMLFYETFIEATGDHVDLFEAWRIKAFLEMEQYTEALEALDQFDERRKSESPDGMLLRALCLAETDQEWLEPFDTAVQMIRDGEMGDCLLGQQYDPCQQLWDYIVAKLPESDERRKTFDHFILERGLAPASYFNPENSDTEETQDTEATEFKPLWRVLLVQSLISPVPAFRGWFAIPVCSYSYYAEWLVVADTDEEARNLALLWQRKCYSAAPCSVLEIEQGGKYPRNTSGILIQSDRALPGEDDENDDKNKNEDEENKE